MTPPAAHAALSANHEPLHAARAPSAVSAAARALAAGGESAENASVEVAPPREVALVAAEHPSASGADVAAAKSESAAAVDAASVVVPVGVEAEPTAAAAGVVNAEDAGGHREDGYVTPPLRLGYISEYTKQQTSTKTASPPSVQTLQPRKLQEQGSVGVFSMASSYSKLAPRESYQPPLGIFTPILFAAQPLGGILSPTSNKRKRIEPSSDGAREQAGAAGGRSDERATTPRRKVSSDYLRKGQWTVTEEKFARALIDAFEEGYLPIYTGIRLRGYLAVQLQCDPMRISKKLCGGSVDGKKIPKNYGQKKFKLRKKQVWDQEEAGRILVNLEKLMRDLWSESGVPQPTFLTLSSTRNASEDGFLSSSHPASFLHGDAAPSSPEPDCSTSAATSPVATKPKRESENAAFPIIYLNLSKNHKKHVLATASNACSAPSGESKRLRASENMSASARRADEAMQCKAEPAAQASKVDGDSLQAAYELLKLFQAPSEEVA